MKSIGFFLALALLCFASLSTVVVLAVPTVAPGTGFNLDGQGTGIYSTRPTGADLSTGTGEAVVQIITQTSNGTFIDYDGDGNKETIVQTVGNNATSQTQTRLYIFEAEGNNDFRQRSTILIDQGANGSSPGLLRGIDVGDVDGDAALEIVAASGTGSSTFLTVYDVNTSTFALTEAVQTQVFGTGGLFTTNGTINQVRILASKNGGANNDILVSNATGTSTGTHLFAVEQSGAALVFVNTTGANSGTAVNSGVIGFNHGDFGDASDEEIVMVTEINGNALVIREYVTNATAPFGTAKTITTNWTGTTTGSLTTVAIADLDDDGDLDAAANDYNGKFVRAVRRTGANTYTSEAIFSVALVANPAAVEVSDFDNDGFPEVVYPNGTSVVFREHDGTADSLASANFGAEGNLLTGLGTGTANAISFLGGIATLDNDLNYDFVVGRSVQVTDTDMDSDEVFFLEADQKPPPGIIASGSYDNLEITGSTFLIGNTTVNGILALTSGNLDVGNATLTMPNTGSSTGTGDVVGNVKRTGFVSGGAPLSFGNPYNTIQINSGTAPTDITVNLFPATPANFTAAVTRTYTITPNGGSGYSVTLQLHYLDAELNGNSESLLKLWREDGGTWNNQGAVSYDPTNNWVRQSGITQLSPWTLANGLTPTATNGTIAGRLLSSNGGPLEGAVVTVNGTQSRKTITDANGFYRFDNVETTGFYTVTPARPNYGFSPSSRSFSLLGINTEASFTGTPATQEANPLDTPEYFVRQHYLDFLGREPDEAGFNFWSDQILGCSSDVACIERRTVNVSAAYFLSIEFQRTGGLVDRLYKASYGRRPLYTEFVADRGIIARDVVVGRTGWEALIDANEEAFVDSWVDRASFRSAFDGLSNEVYVDTLIANTEVSFSQTARESLLVALNQGALSRADALLRIATNENFAKARFNEAFVMMEYFGYLRRDPDASGYEYWLNKLNQFGGNFERAEMVKAFINSAEYRSRFAR